MTENTLDHVLCFDPVVAPTYAAAVTTTIRLGASVVAGNHGTPEQVRERLEELAAAGANHFLLNPVARCAEQLEALAAVAGFA